MTPLLVLHALGDDRGGASWRAALLENAWDGPSSAPDQPGHGDAPWEADFYEGAHLVVAPFRHLVETGWRERPVVVAVGVQAAAAELLALGGKAAAIVLVDPPRGPLPDGPEASQRAEYAWLRTVADDADAQAPAPYGRTVPRTRHGLTPRHDASWAAKQRAAVPVPVLELDGGEPAEVLVKVREWWASVDDGR